MDAISRILLEVIFWATVVILLAAGITLILERRHKRKERHGHRKADQARDMGAGGGTDNAVVARTLPSGKTIYITSATNASSNITGSGQGGWTRANNANLSTYGYRLIRSQVNWIADEPALPPEPEEEPTLYLGKKIGYKVVEVSAQGMIATRNTPWPPGERLRFECECRFDGWTHFPNHATLPWGMPGGVCGIYAMSRPNLGPHGREMAVIAVELTGDVVVHEHGYRAEYARPVRLLAPDPATSERHRLMIERYGMAYEPAVKENA